jgi:hypothetical protein
VSLSVDSAGRHCMNSASDTLDDLTTTTLVVMTPPPCRHHAEGKSTIVTKPGDYTTDLIGPHDSRFYLFSPQ